MKLRRARPPGEVMGMRFIGIDYGTRRLGLAYSGTSWAWRRRCRRRWMPMRTDAGPGWWRW